MTRKQDLVKGGGGHTELRKIQGHEKDRWKREARGGWSPNVREGGTDIAVGPTG